jgi:CRP-like cAMP-binding protein
MATPPVVRTPLQLLAALPLFQGLPERDLAGLAEQTRLDSFEAEATIFHQGDPCDRFWLLRQGQVKIVRQEEDGREVILEMISPGDAFGGAVLFMTEHPATARPLVPSETLSFTSEAYRQVVLGHPPLAIRLIRMLGERLHSMMGLHVMAGERVERRLAHILLKLADRAGREEPEGVLITLPLSRQDLADMSGTTLETAIRTMSRFRQQGIVQTRRGGYLLITDLDRLRQQGH